MPYLIVLFVLALILNDSVHLPCVGNGLASASHGGSVGGILVGLFLCLPLVGFLLLIRRFSRWQVGFHHRMSTMGAVPRKSSGTL